MNSDFYEKYRKDGYYVISGLIEEKRATQLLDAIHQLFYLQLKRFEPKSHCSGCEYIERDMKQLLDINVDAYLGAARRCAKLVTLQKYLSQQCILDAVKQLGISIPTIVTEPVMHINSEKLIIPGGYAGFNTHQDWPSIQGSLDCVVVWTPLVEIHQTNFPLQVIPGSHRHGMYDGKITENLFEICPDLYSTDDYISIQAKPGDVVIMSSWTLHRTGMHNSKGFRLSCSTRFDNAEENTFIERGYPCAYQRSVNRKLITPNFPSTKQVREIYGE